MKPIEVLEERTLLSATFSRSWPGPHNLNLTLENGSPSTSGSYDATINAAQFAAGSNAATFSGVIIGPDTNFHLGDAEVRIKVQGSPNPPTSITSFSDPAPSSIPGRDQVTFASASVPGLTPNAVTTIRVSALRPGFPTAVLTPDIKIFVDTTTPMVTGISSISPNPRGTPVGTVRVTLSEPIDLSTFTADDLTLTRDATAVPLPGSVTVSAVSGMDSTYDISGLTGVTTAGGDYVLTVGATGIQDVAGNPGSGSMAVDWTNDPSLNIPPAPPPPTFDPSSDTGYSSTDRITRDTTPTFNASGIGATQTVQLVIVGGPQPLVVGSRVGPGPITASSVPTNSSGQPISGTYRYALRVLSDMGVAGILSSPVSLVIDAAAPQVSATLSSQDRTLVSDIDAATMNTRPTITVTINDPPAGNTANLLFTKLVAVDGSTLASPVVAPPVAPGTEVSLTVPTPLSPGLHTVIVQATDAAGNTVQQISSPFLITTNAATGSPGTPVFSTMFDFQYHGENDFVIPGPDRADQQRPWNITFDRTTQTVWVALRGPNNMHGSGNETTPPNSGGNRIMHFDPATGTATIYNLNLPGIDISGNPHGIIFDFETHLTPRVWFAQKDAGKLSYLDLATGDMVNFDVLGLLIKAGVHTNNEDTHQSSDTHAIAVDATGNVWMTDVEDNIILEFDFHHLPDGTPTSGLDSNVGTLILHRLPQRTRVNLNPNSNAVPPAGSHGIEVLTDDRTGQPIVYVTDLDLGTATMLLPRQGANGNDRFYRWDMSGVLQDEGLTGGDPQFIGIDTNETPGRPEDDRVFFADSGPVPVTARNNVIRELRPGNILLDPTATSSPVETFHIPSQGSANAQPTQVFADRDGEIFYVDRFYGIGRLDPSDPVLAAGQGSSDGLAQVPIQTFESSSLKALVTPMERFQFPADFISNIVLPPSRITTTVLPDVSGMGGIDQYSIHFGSDNITTPTQGQGVFRGTINAGDVLYGSLSLNDKITTAVFAETPRRETAVLDGPGDARMAFQVINGTVIVTHHDNGQLVDRQDVLTTSASDPRITGDVSPVRDAAGVVHVFGLDEQGGVSEYRLDPTTGVWTSRRFGTPLGLASSDPSAYVDPVRGAAAIVTRRDGHLLLYFADNGQVLDLTSLSGAGDAGKVYSPVGIVEFNGRIYAYGTTQTGALVEYGIPFGGSGQVTERTVLDGSNRDTRVLQDVAAIVDGSTRHVFAIDGTSRLVHIAIAPNGSATAENVTVLTQNTAAGYAPYQQPYAARIYPGLTPVIAPNGDLYVYGTNGRDLIEFHRPVNGAWSAADLTNLPANKVFGAPGAYILPNGDRHVLLINEDGELIEYTNLAALNTWSTLNLTLALGNSTSDNPPIITNPLPSAPPGPIVDDHPDTAGPQATPIAFDPTGQQAVGSGTIGTASDVDVFRVDVPRRGIFVVRVTPTGGSVFYPRLTILNSAGRPVVRARNGAALLRAFAARPYYLSVQGRNGTTGGYTITVSGPPQHNQIGQFPHSNRSMLNAQARWQAIRERYQMRLQAIRARLAEQRANVALRSASRPWTRWFV